MSADVVLGAIQAWGPVWGIAVTVLGLYWLRHPRRDRPASQRDLQEAVNSFDETAMARAVASELQIDKHTLREVRLAENVVLHVDAKLEVL